MRRWAVGVIVFFIFTVVINIGFVVWTQKNQPKVMEIPDEWKGLKR